MESVLTQLGLSPKEAKFYLFLLNETLMTASQIAKRLHESRTNTYMVLDKLAEEGLALCDSSSAIKKFAAADPEVLDKKLHEREEALSKSRAALNKVLPRLTNSYKEAEAKRALSPIEVPKKHQPIIQETSETEKTVRIIASQGLPNLTEAWTLISAVISARNSKSYKTELVYHKSDAKNPLITNLASNSLKSRAVAEKLQDGGVILYGNRIVLISHDAKPKLTAMNNAPLEATLNSVFEQLWRGGEGDSQ
jgi:sugar-specific transcriptional regulator TrmB